MIDLHVKPLKYSVPTATTNAGGGFTSFLGPFTGLATPAIGAVLGSMGFNDIISSADFSCWRATFPPSKAKASFEAFTNECLQKCNMSTIDGVNLYIKKMRSYELYRRRNANAGRSSCTTKGENLAADLAKGAYQSILEKYRGKRGYKISNSPVELIRLGWSHWNDLRDTYPFIEFTPTPIGSVLETINSVKKNVAVPKNPILQTSLTGSTISTQPTRKSKDLKTKSLDTFKTLSLLLLIPVCYIAYDKTR